MTIISLKCLLIICNTALGLCLSQSEPRIVGGTNSFPRQFSYQVSLQWGNPPFTSFKHFCGGSIISKQWILTAAHCIRDVPKYGIFLVKAGKYDISIEEITEQKVQVKKAVVHRNFFGRAAPFDIAMVLLKKPLIFNEYVTCISLPKQNVIPSGSAILSGWGSISATSRPIEPKILQYMNVPLLNLTICRKAIEKIVGPSSLHITNICTGPLTGGFAACSGDSGGPLIINQNNKREIVGISSWGIHPCGRIGAPSVYTRTSAFVDWIRRTIKLYS